jgi:DNA invertase Pin-like site-specific DNA recombinase
MAAKAPTGPEAAVPAAEAEEKKPSRASQMREMFKAGKSRSEVAKELGVTYQTVFAATRGVEGGGGTSVGRQKIMVTHPDTGDEVPRIDLIRELFEHGKSRGEIAKLLNTTYQIVYQATKGAEQAEADDEDEELEDGEEAEDGEEDEDDEDETTDDDGDAVIEEDLLPPTR